MIRLTVKEVMTVLEATNPMFNATLYYMLPDGRKYSVRKHDEDFIEVELVSTIPDLYDNDDSKIVSPEKVKQFLVEMELFPAKSGSCPKSRIVPREELESLIEKYLKGSEIYFTETVKDGYEILPVEIVNWRK